MNKEKEEEERRKSQSWSEHLIQHTIQYVGVPINSRGVHLPRFPSWHETIKTWPTETTRKRKVLICTELIMSIKKTWAFLVREARGKGDERRKNKNHSGYHCATMSSRVPLLVSRPSPDCVSAFFCVVTALNEKNAGQPNFPPPFVSPLQ